MKKLKHEPRKSFLRGILFKRQENFGGLLGQNLPSQILYEKLLAVPFPDNGTTVQEHLAMVNTKVERLRSIEKRILREASRRFLLGRIVSLASVTTATALLLVMAVVPL